MVDYESMSSTEFFLFCEHNLVPLTFEVCVSCDKAYHPHDTRPGRCMCGHLKQVKKLRLPRSMLTTYLNAMKGVYRWK